MPCFVIKKIDCKDSKIFPNIPLSIGYRRVKAVIKTYGLLYCAIGSMCMSHYLKCLYMHDKE